MAARTCRFAVLGLVHVAYWKESRKEDLEPDNLVDASAVRGNLKLAQWTRVVIAD